MLTELYTALTIWAIALPFFLSIGINGFRYAWMLKLAWPLYVESSFWFVFGLISCWRLYAVIILIRTDGLPVGYSGVGTAGWISFILGLLFIIFMAFGKYIAIRQVKRMEASRRANVANLHNAAWSLKRELNV